MEITICLNPKDDARGDILALAAQASVSKEVARIKFKDLTSRDSWVQVDDGEIEFGSEAILAKLQSLA